MSIDSAKLSHYVSLTASFNPIVLKYQAPVSTKIT
jgi:hypothetical protein